MARNKSACKFKHTPISPAKNDVRCKMVFDELEDDLITISHGITDMAIAYKNFTGWNKRILMADMDTVVQHAIRDTASVCPGLNILPPQGDILTAVKWYLQEFGPDGLGVVDVDLAFQLKTNGKDYRHPSATDIVLPVLDELLAAGCKCKVLLTFVKARDRYFSTDKDRVAWFRKQLPNGVKLVQLVSYHSYRIDDWSRYSQGSNMGIFELQVSGRRIKKAA